MAAFINTNIASMNSQRNLNTSQTALTTSLQRLSSGLRINSAKDDAAGLAISERMTSQINGSDQAARNANDGISLAQTAEGDLAQIGTNLQRMRELAVQASNGTNSASDRAALNGEVQSLAAEIDRVAQNSSFNGVKLLDGSFSAQDFQIGANNTSNDRITISSISSARTSQLGGVGTSFAATKSGTAVTGALNAGDLTLNGFQVGASQLGAAPGQGTSSAFSVAAAINTISSSSGVTATAAPSTLAATATNFNAVNANSFSVNGVNVGAIAAGTTASGQGANVAAAINAISTQSGVTASADATTGAVTLTAADGRDIAIQSELAGQSGANQTATKTSLEARIGFSIGTGKVIAGGTAPTQAAVASAASDIFTTTASQGKIAANSVSVTVASGTYMLGDVDLTGTAAQNATNLSAAINAATGAATTTVATNVVTMTAAVTLQATGSAPDQATSDAAQAKLATQFGATATLKIGGQMYGAATTTTAQASATTHGTVSLSSTSAAGIVWAGAAASKAGLGASGTAAATVSSSVSSLASMDVLTSANATKAITAIDGALATVSTSRASLGAYQNRFASVVSSLQTSSENLSASRSRIQDTDFAKETASLTRGQILQQAGTAMLAQANSLPNGVLALLRG